MHSEQAEYRVRPANMTAVQLGSSSPSSSLRDLENGLEGVEARIRELITDTLTIERRLMGESVLDQEGDESIKPDVERTGVLPTLHRQLAEVHSGLNYLERVVASLSRV